MALIERLPSQTELDRKARRKAKLDNTKTYAYGWTIPRAPKIGDKVTIQTTYGSKGLKSSLSYNEGWETSDVVIEIESKITRVLRRCDLKDISNEYTTTPSDSNTSICGDSSVHQSERTSEEWNG